MYAYIYIDLGHVIRHRMRRTYFLYRHITLPKTIFQHSIDLSDTLTRMEHSVKKVNLFETNTQELPRRNDMALHQFIQSFHLANTVQCALYRCTHIDIWSAKINFANAFSSNGSYWRLTVFTFSYSTFLHHFYPFRSSFRDTW